MTKPLRSRVGKQQILLLRLASVCCVVHLSGSNSDVHMHHALLTQ